MNWNKKDLLKACIEQVRENMSNLQKLMDDAQQAANEYGPPKDRYDSFRAQLLRKRDMYGQQLSKFGSYIEALEKISEEKVHEKVEFGSVVDLGPQKIFIAAAIGKVLVRGVTVHVISGSVPVFEAMKGKTAGDSYEFNNQAFQIKSVF